MFSFLRLKNYFIRLIDIGIKGKDVTNGKTNDYNFQFK